MEWESGVDKRLLELETLTQSLKDQTQTNVRQIGRRGDGFRYSEGEWAERFEKELLQHAVSGQDLITIG